MPEELWRAHSLEKSKDSDGEITTSGSFSYWADEPDIELGNWPVDGTKTFEPVPGTSLTVKKVSVTDNVIGMKNGRPFRQWQITIEGDSTSGDDNSLKTTYTFEKYKDDNGLVFIKGSVVIAKNATKDINGNYVDPSLDYELDSNNTINFPVVGALKCTRISAGDEWTEKGVRRWTITYECAKVYVGDNNFKPEDGDVNDNVSYELNGTTARAVDGEFVALRRSATPITKRSIIRYSKNGAKFTTPGNEYAGNIGIVVSERVTKETVKENGVEIGSYYRHDIEVEA